jgi:PPE-repeat protein
MVAQYWGLAPEVNAIRLTTGPGAAAMAPVTAAYEAAGITHMEQGTQMMTTAAATAGGSWQGLGGTAMMDAAGVKSAWQLEAAGHAEKAAGLITEAAAVHSAAVAATIPYSVVIANRVREAALQAANIPALGMLTPAIVEANIEYEEYWGQNAAAMTGYATAATGIVAGLSVPLTPPPVLGGNPLGIALGVASTGAQFAQTGLQASVQGLGAPLEAAGQAASAGPSALSATFTASPAQHVAEQGDSGATSAPLPRAGGGDLLSSGQSMLGLANAAPQMVSGLAQPLSQVAQLPGQIGGQLSGMLGSLPGMGGGPGGGLAAAAPGTNLAASMGGVSGGYGSGGGAVSAALTKSAGGIGGPAGLPSTWWGPASVDEGPNGSGQGKPAAAARAGTSGVGVPGSAMGPGMYGAPAAAAGGARRDQDASRGRDDTSLSVVLEDADAIPVLTADGVVYSGGG